MSDISAVVFIDAENNPDLEPSRLLSRLDAKFDVSEVLAFADFTKDWMRGIARRLHKAGITMIHVESRNGRGFRANAVDKVMSKTIRQRAGNGRSPSVFVIVSGDQGFTGPVYALRGLRKRVVIAANPHRTSRRLMQAANDFVPL